MVVSWAARACELWALGLEKSDQTLAGEDLGAAAKHVWRLEYLYEGLKNREPSWKLPASGHILYEGERMLKSFTLPNGSRCQYANGLGNSLRGEGTSIITLEEFGIYPYASQMYAQAIILTQPSKEHTSGFVNIITNASFLKAWQDVKKPITENISLLQDEATGFQIADLPGGEQYIKLHHYANEDFDSEWIEGRRRAMTATPVTFRLEYLMDDTRVEGALLTRDIIERTRVKGFNESDVVKRVIAVDPSIKDHEKVKNPNSEGDDVGIIVACLALVGEVPHIYIEHDFSGKYSPARWSKIIKTIASKLGEGTDDQWMTKDGNRVLVKGTRGTPISEIVYESNQGGALVEQVIRTAELEGDPGQEYLIPLDVPMRGVHASIGKRARAEPVAKLWENGQIHIVGRLPKVEDEWSTWDSTHPAGLSPARVDAVTWAVFGLGLATGHKVKQVGGVSLHQRRESV